MLILAMRFLTFTVVAGIKLKKKKTGSRVLVIYGNKILTDSSVDFLRAVTARGGHADTISSRLRKEDLTLIYLSNDNQIFGIHDSHFQVIRISAVQLHLYEELKTKKDLEEQLSLAENALYNYSWLSKHSFSEKKSKISELVRSGQLKNHLESIIRGVDQEEDKVLKVLIKKSINKLILFATCYFEGITVDEYSELIRLFISSGTRELKNEDAESRVAGLRLEWMENADEVLNDCGIVLEPSGYYSSYRFESRARKENAIKLFSNQYRFFLLNQFESISSNLLYSSRNLSAKLLDNIFEYTNLIAAVDPKKYISGLCGQIADKLIKAEDKEAQLKNLFWRLRYLVKKWSGHAEFGSYITKFYNNMLETPGRRNILASILSYTCEPEQEENLHHLRKLLNATGEDERYIRNRLISIVIHNYQDDLHKLFTILNSWKETSNNKTHQTAFSVAYSSIALAIYEKRFNHLAGRDLDYQIVSRSFIGNPESSFSGLIDILFSVETETVFNSVFGPIISKQAQELENIGKVKRDAYYLMYGYILCRWYYLLSSCLEENHRHDIKSEELFMKIVERAGKVMELRLLGKALMAAVGKYNELVRLEKKSSMDNLEKKNAYIKIRDGGRLIISLINNYESSN
jgi:hypothetical protein